MGNEAGDDFLQLHVLQKKVRFLATIDLTRQ